MTMPRSLRDCRKANWQISLIGMKPAGSYIHLTSLPEYRCGVNRLMRRKVFPLRRGAHGCRISFYPTKCLSCVIAARYVIPNMFPNFRKDTVKYSMLETANDQSCGLSHNCVTFPLNEYDKCCSSPGQ